MTREDSTYHIRSLPLTAITDFIRQLHPITTNSRAITTFIRRKRLNSRVWDKMDIIYTTTQLLNQWESSQFWGKSRGTSERRESKPIQDRQTQGRVFQISVKKSFSKNKQLVKVLPPLNRMIEAMQVWWMGQPPLQCSTVICKIIRRSPTVTMDWIWSRAAATRVKTKQLEIL